MYNKKFLLGLLLTTFCFGLLFVFSGVGSDPFYSILHRGEIESAPDIFSENDKYLTVKVKQPVKCSASMVLETTAYSPAEPGMSSYTCLGKKLEANRTIAVDPNVIPLGSRVVIDGNVWEAGDTGGAIRGNIVDLCFASVEECNSWGRRNVDAKIYYPDIPLFEERKVSVSAEYLNENRKEFEDSFGKIIEGF